MAFKEAKNAALKEMKAKVINLDATLFPLSSKNDIVTVIVLGIPVALFAIWLPFLTLCCTFDTQVVREFKKREGGKGMGKMKWDAQVRNAKNVSFMLFLLYNLGFDCQVPTIKYWGEFRCIVFYSVHFCRYFADPCHFLYSLLAQTNRCA